MNILATQQKMQYKAVNSSSAFYQLFNFLENPVWLKEAYLSISQNVGAETPGSDGITMNQFKSKLNTNLECLSEALVEGSYKPKPYRCIRIKKVNGGTRLLNIPTISDRIVQEGIRMLLTPIFEADFSPYSYAYRHKLSIHDAISHLAQGSYKRPFVLESDIKECFDSVNHTVLLTLLSRRIRDNHLLNLIKKMLKAGTLDKNRLYKTQQGIPQGAVISPLLCNIYLHELDIFMAAGYINETKLPISYARFADDFVVLCHSKAQAEGIYGALKGFLASRLQLTLASEKTFITHLNKGINFLGFNLKHNNTLLKPHLQVLIPVDTVRAAQEHILHLTSEDTYHQDLAIKIRQLNFWLRGWCGTYKRASNAGAVFVKIEQFLHEAIAVWLAGKYRINLRAVRKKFFKNKTFVTDSQKLLLPSQMLQSAKQLPYSANTIEKKAA